MATIKDVAKRAGVSNGTVSKVINNYELVSDETRNKVLQAIDELNYIPNRVASSLSSKNKNRIGLIVKVNETNQSIDEISMQYILGATNYAHENDIDVTTIFSTELVNMSAIEIATYLKSLSINGIIMYAISLDDTELHELINLELFKCVVVDGSFLNNSVGSVMINHREAQYNVAKALYKTSPTIRKILYIAGKQNGFVTKLRCAGIESFCKEHNVKLKSLSGNFSESEAYKITKDYANDYDAILCASDLMAIGALRALRELDIYRPITGFDGIKLMGYVAEDILTVKQDFNLISQLALTELMTYLEDDAHPTVRYVDYAIQLIKYEDIIS